MNERIQELAEQSRVSVIDPQWMGIDPEKFTESIVRECLEQIEKNFVGAIGTHASAHNSAVLKCKKSIQEHFGVE